MEMFMDNHHMEYMKIKEHSYFCK